MNISKCSLFFMLNFAFILQFSQGKKSKIPCPPMKEIGCIECECDDTGFHACKAIEKCPALPTSVADVKKPHKDAHCTNGKKFKAECAVCECSGEADQCSICFALPIKRNDQPPEVNKILNDMHGNQLINYEVEGWEKSLHE